MRCFGEELWANCHGIQCARGQDYFKVTGLLHALRRALIQSSTENPVASAAPVKRVPVAALVMLEMLRLTLRWKNNAMR